MNRILVLLITFICILAPLANSKEFSRAIQPRDWSFPRDHGKHPDFKTEWWYFTGHLGAEDQTYGFELTIFRFANPLPEKIKSAWASDQIYLTHFTVTDGKKGKFYKYELANRDVFDLAGASTEKLKVWNGIYSVEQDDGKLHIKAENSEVKLDLVLNFESEVVLNGKNGLSQKGKKHGDASYYYSIPRMEGTGNLKIKERSMEVKKASVWMDREFFTIPESSENSGWDWFAIQFDTGANLMVYRIRNKANEQTRFSSGTYVDEKGNQHILGIDDFNLTPIEFWKSPETEAEYPLKWDIVVPEFGIDIRIDPVMKNQELVLEEFLDINYWEGRCIVSGSHSGQAYMELVGY